MALRSPPSFRKYVCQKVIYFNNAIVARVWELESKKQENMATSKKSVEFDQSLLAKK